MLTNWIESPPTDDARITWFRRRTEGARHIRITADSRYKLYLDGQLLQFGPAKGDRSVWFADELDLPSGDRLVEVAVLHYPEAGERGNHSLFRFDKPRLYVEGLGAEGWECRTERGRRFYAEETRFAPLQIHELVAPEPEDEWRPARLCPWEELPEALRPENLAPRGIPFMYRVPRSFALPFSEFPANSEQSFTLDAGEETCAFLRLALSGGRGARIELLQSECYVLESGKGDRLDAESGHLEGYADYYTVSGAEGEVYEPYWFRTFRFLRVTVRTGDESLTIRSIDYEETGYPLEVRTRVTTSDGSLERIWDMSLRTLRRCMHETYVDCPFYEQLQYAMDTRSQILYTYAVSADDRLARRAIDDFRRAQRPDGLLNCSYPNVNVNVIPGFSIYYIMMVHDHMLYFGDRELVRRCLPSIDRVLDFFARNLTPEGLVGKVGGVNGKAEFWSFIDWAEPWMDTEGMPTAGLYGPLTMESILYLMGLTRASELCAWLGEGRAEDYAGRAETLKAAIRRYCMDEDVMLTDGPGREELSQHCQVFGLLSGVLTKDEARRNMERSLTEPGIAQCTVATAFYLFRALELTGLYAHTDRCWDIWRRMAANGCSTCVEGENYPRSECHAWGALALYELPSVALGVRPAAPGYERIEVAPNPGYLSSASGTVHTPHGDITVSWHLESGELRTSIDCAPELRERIVSK